MKTYTPRGMRRTAAGLLATLIGLAPAAALAQSAPASTITPEERAAAIAEPSVVYIETYYSGFVRTPEGTLVNNEPIEFATRCTGFVVNPAGYIATAGHCADTSDEGVGEDFITSALVSLVENGYLSQEEAEYLYEDALSSWRVEGRTAGRPAEMEVFVQYGVAKGGERSGDALPARVLESKPISQGDVAILKVEKELPSLEISEVGNDIQIGTPVLAIGYPASSDDVTDQSVEPTFKDGKVSARKTRLGGLIPIYEISAATSQGMSGGPVVDLAGRVIGLVSFSAAREEQAFNFLSPASLVKEALARSGAQNTLSAGDRTYREGLKLLFAGDGKAATVKLQAVLDENPSHPRAQEFLREAREVAATQKGGGLPVPILAAVAGVLIALGLGGFLFARTRRRPAYIEPASTPQYVPQMAAAPAPTPIAAPAPSACPSCGTDNSPDMAFCGRCGASLGAEPPKPARPRTRAKQ